MKIQTPQEYQVVYMKAMDQYAFKHGLVGNGKTLSVNEIRNILDDVCQAIRVVCNLSEAEHIAYKEMMLMITFGKNKGRK